MTSLIVGAEEKGRMFVLDDATPFGVRLPSDLLALLKEYNRVKVLDAAGLAEDLYLLADRPDVPVTAVGSGAILTLALLSRMGCRPDYNIVGVERIYGKPLCNERASISFRLTQIAKLNPRLVDDVVASGSTINYVMTELGIREPPDVLALVLSGDTRGEYREADGSTVKNVSAVYVARSVASTDGGRPAILSARFLLKKAREDASYRRYLDKYAGGRAEELLELVRGVDTKPFDLLYNDPIAFLKEFG